MEYEVVARHEYGNMGGQKGKNMTFSSSESTTTNMYCTQR
jgi:hypothetical protein